MRISVSEQIAIVEEAHNQFGVGVSVLLFGSRTKDELRGGDIDLLIIPSQNIARKNLYEKKINFLIKLKQRIDDQKIDVVIAKNGDKRSIVQTAKSEGLILC